MREGKAVSRMREWKAGKVGEQLKIESGERSAIRLMSIMSIKSIIRQPENRNGREYREEWGKALCKVDVQNEVTGCPEWGSPLRGS